jgi:septal ring factor EnvC (AmiA/AmiB activator)
MNSATQFNLGAADRIDNGSSNVNWTEAAKFSDNRLQGIERLSTGLKSQEHDFIQKERQFLNGSLAFLDSFAIANEDFIRQEEEKIKKLDEEIRKHKPEQEANEGQNNEVKGHLRTLQEKIDNAHEQQKQLNNRRKEVIETIKPEELAAIKFKDHLDESNDIFKWILEGVYKQSRSDYGWKNFKAAVFKKDKGADFMNRLRGLNVQKLRKDTLIYCKTVVDKREPYLADLETPKKQNPSLRALLDYMSLVVQVGELYDQIEADKAHVDEQTKLLEKKMTNSIKLSTVIKGLEDRIANSRHYIQVLGGLKSLFTETKALTNNRINAQGQYYAQIGGDSQALETLAPTTQTQGRNVRAHAGAPEDEETAQGESVKEEKYEGHEAEEAQFSGEQAFGTPKERKVENKNANLTDLGESEFAASKKGNCESCSIF